MNKTKLNINWSNVVAFIIPTLVFAAECLFIAWILQMSEQEVQNMNTEARCKTVGGEMGYSKCFKDGKEI
jgi:hypothetical protein